MAAHGHTVTVYDDLSTGSAGNLDGVEARLIEGDIQRYDRLLEAMQGAEWVFHLAAFISVPQSVEQPVECYDINLNGSLNVLRAAQAAGVKRVVLASSAAVYGETDSVVDESQPPQPQSPYASSKLAMEGAAQLYGELYGLETVCLRYFNVFGPKQAPGSAYAAVIPEFIRCLLNQTAPNIHGEGTQSRDFVFVQDVVQANLLAAEAEGAAGRVLNIAGGKAISVSQLLQELQALVPGTPDATYGPPRAGDIHYSHASIQAAETALGYRPQVSLETGLQSTVEWFRYAGDGPQVET